MTSLNASSAQNVSAQTQQITFYQSTTQVDQVTYSGANNNITFAAISSFNGSQLDIVTYYQYLNSFLATLTTNFPNISGSANTPLPLCTFSLVQTSLGVTHLNYTQDTGSTLVMGINYVPTAVAGSFSARSTAVTITMQEFIFMMNFLNQYVQQVSLNPLDAR